MTLSKKTTILLEAVSDIAFNGNEEEVQSADIARRLILPRRYVEQLLNELVRAGILSQGERRGWFKLARKRDVMSLGEVIRAVSEAEAVEEFGASSELGRQVLGRICNAAEAAFIGCFDRITLEAVCAMALTKGVSVERKSPA